MVIPPAPVPETKWTDTTSTKPCMPLIGSRLHKLQCGHVVATETGESCGRSCFHVPPGQEEQSYCPFLCSRCIEQKLERQWGSLIIGLRHKFAPEVYLLDDLKRFLHESGINDDPTQPKEYLIKEALRKCVRACTYVRSSVDDIDELIGMTGKMGLDRTQKAWIAHVISKTEATPALSQNSFALFEDEDDMDMNDDSWFAQDNEEWTEKDTAMFGTWFEGE